MRIAAEWPQVGQASTSGLLSRSVREGRVWSVQVRNTCTGARVGARRCVPPGAGTPRGAERVTEDVDAALRASRTMLGIVARSIAPALEQVSLPHFRVLVL